MPPNGLTADDGAAVVAPALVNDAMTGGDARGEGVTIAVVDVAIDTRHPEFVGRVVGEWDAGSRSSATRALGWQPHGTQVAGLALAGGRHVRGAAPRARLLAIAVPALAHRVGDPTQSDGIRWAAEHGADVICCAWGPPPSAAPSLPAHASAAFEWALEFGRGGKGCVLVFSSGNDGSDLRLNPYASYPGVMAVGACNRHGRRPGYSGWGRALWCVAQSNDPVDPVGCADTWLTTTPVGSFLRGETNYAAGFGFTSAACALVAGTCARILSANPGLGWREVRDVLASTCTTIDREGGEYDGRGHSPWYGFGRVDPALAVATAAQKNRGASVYRV